MSEKSKTKNKTNEPHWTDGIKIESVQNAIKIGVVYPKFKAYKDTVYLIHLISEPKLVDNEKGKFWTIDIEKDNMKFTLNMNESFKFQLFKLLTEKNCSLKDLLNKVPLHIAQDSNGYWSIQLLQDYETYKYYQKTI